MQTLFPELYGYYNRLCTHVLSVAALVDSQAHAALRRDIDKLTVEPPSDHLIGIVEQLSAVTPTLFVIAYNQDADGPLPRSVLTLAWQFVDSEDRRVMAEAERRHLAGVEPLNVPLVRSMLEGAHTPTPNQMEIAAIMADSLPETWHALDSRADLNGATPQ